MYSFQKSTAIKKTITPPSTKNYLKHRKKTQKLYQVTLLIVPLILVFENTEHILYTHRLLKIPNLMFSKYFKISQI